MQNNNTPGITLAGLAEALCCHPRTLSRLLTGASNPYSKPKAVVSLARAAKVLKTDETALSHFLEATKKKTDEAVDLEVASRILGYSERHIRRKLVGQQIPVLAHFGHTIRFSKETLKQIAAAR